MVPSICRLLWYHSFFMKGMMDLIQVLVVDPFGNIVTKEQDEFLTNSDKIVYHMYESYFKLHPPYIEMHHIPNLLDHYLYTKSLCNDLGYLIIFIRQTSIGLFIPEVVSEEQLKFFERELLPSKEQNRENAKKKMMAFQCENNTFQFITTEDISSSWVKVYESMQENYDWESLSERKERNKQKMKRKH